MFQVNMTFLLIFGLFIVIATAHNITFLDVPQYGDPRYKSDLICNYINEKGDPPLHSVKWYRENNEIFRFTPGQQPATRIFNTTITPTTPTVVGGDCNLHSCKITVLLPKKYNTQISFTCEVSTEGPRFAVVKQTKHLTVAVALKEDPNIIGLPGSVQRGEDITLNCSTVAAMPPANIIWFIDGRPDRLREPWMENKTEVSAPDADGLRGSWRVLRLRVTSPKSIISLSCQATQPTKPPFVRHTNVSLIVAQTPQISMFSASQNSPGAEESNTCWLVFSTSGMSDVTTRDYKWSIIKWILIPTIMCCKTLVYRCILQGIFNDSVNLVPRFQYNKNGVYIRYIQIYRGLYYFF